MRLKYIILLGLLSLLSACQDCDPQTPPDGRVVVRFLDPSDNDDITIDFDSVYGYSTTFQGGNIPRDNNDAYRLPLSTEQEQISFVFAIQGLQDTLHLSYQKKVIINGPDCGNFETFGNLQALINGDTDQAQSIIKFRDSAIFDSLVIFDEEGSVGPALINGDTTTANIRIFIANCTDVSPNQEMVISFFDPVTDTPVSKLFERVYRKEFPNRPILTSLAGEVTSFIVELIPGEESITLVFEERAENGLIESQQITFTFSSNISIIDDFEGCLQNEALGNLRLISEDSIGIDSTAFPSGILFDSALINRSIINSNNTIPNVKIFTQQPTAVDDL
ncbi:hypothetical protein [Algivirga pacifica]|uniref:DUF4382 domain-containing protein n=1 Tax=Algivirga pacifica TaxID=1162670 RepID=A0ABP9D717_9BACT